MNHLDHWRPVNDDDDDDDVFGTTASPLALQIHENDRRIVCDDDSDK